MFKTKIVIIYFNFSARKALFKSASAMCNPYCHTIMIAGLKCFLACVACFSLNVLIVYRRQLEPFGRHQWEPFGKLPNRQPEPLRRNTRQNISIAFSQPFTTHQMINTLFKVEELYQAWTDIHLALEKITCIFFTIWELIAVPKRMNFRKNSKGVGGRSFPIQKFIADFGPLNRAFSEWKWYKMVFSGYVFSCPDESLRQLYPCHWVQDILLFDIKEPS